MHAPYKKKKEKKKISLRAKKDVWNGAHTLKSLSIASISLCKILYCENAIPSSFIWLLFLGGTSLLCHTSEAACLPFFRIPKFRLMHVQLSPSLSSLTLIISNVILTVWRAKYYIKRQSFVIFFTPHCCCEYSYNFTRMKQFSLNLIWSKKWPSYPQCKNLP